MTSYFKHLTMPSRLPRKSQKYADKKRLNTYIWLGRRTHAKVGLLPKTFSNRNQLVSSFLKNFDRVWKDIMSKKHIFLSTTKKKKPELKDLHGGLWKRYEKNLAKEFTLREIKSKKNIPWTSCCKDKIVLGLLLATSSYSTFWSSGFTFNPSPELHAEKKK